MTTTYLLFAILISAACTLLLRAVPFLLFGRGGRMPAAVERLANRMPAAIIAVLVVYCLKSTPTMPFREAGASFLAAASVIGLHLWKRNTLLSIAGGTVLYMLLLRFPV